MNIHVNEFHNICIHNRLYMQKGHYYDRVLLKAIDENNIKL
jgi:hypothetical protein